MVQASPYAHGFLASKDAIRAAGSELAETLDVRIRNYAMAHGGDEDQFIHRMTRQVASQMIAVLESAQMRVRALYRLGLVEDVPAVCLAKIIPLSKESHSPQRLFFIQDGGGQLLIQQGQRITQAHTPGVHFLDLRQGDRFAMFDRKIGESASHRMVSILQSKREDSLVRDSLVWELQRDRTLFADRPAHVLVHTVSSFPKE